MPFRTMPRNLTGQTCVFRKEPTVRCAIQRCDWTARGASNRRTNRGGCYARGTRIRPRGSHRDFRPPLRDVCAASPAGRVRDSRLALKRLDVRRPARSSFLEAVLARLSVSSRRVPCVPNRLFSPPLPSPVSARNTRSSATV